jgi:diguanylate cyclase (GGDEF)-like protein
VRNRVIDDVPNLTTLLAMVVFTPALAGCLLMLSWLQHRRQLALGVWGSGFLTASVAATLIIAARGVIPDFWSIVFGNALLAIAYGILWCGARTFEGKTVSIPLALFGLLAWLVACLIVPIFARPEARALVIAAVGVCYTLLAVSELWRGRGDGAWRWPIIALLLAHAASIPLYIPVAGAWKHPDPADVDLLTFTVFEAAFVSICGAYFLGGLVTDRIAASHWRASLTDPLTGVTNRRGFFEVGERLLARECFVKQPVAVIMFDLDRFKRINDQFGHAIGDEVLIAFCRLVVDQLRPTDLFARVGGEEFAALLTNTTSLDAVSLAERIRASIAAASLAFDQHTIYATVSMGVASLDEGMTELSALLRAADQALYRAKEGGRNRVELSSAHRQWALGRRSEKESLQGRSAA